MKNVKFSYLKNLNLYGDNNIQMSVYVTLIFHFQRQLLKPAK